MSSEPSNRDRAGESASPQAHDAAQLMIYALSVGLGAALLLVSLGFGLRDDLGDALFRAPLWMKWSYAISMALIAWLLCERLVRSDRAGGLAWLPLLPIAMLTLLALRTQLALPEPARMATWLGERPVLCPASIALLSLPAFAALCRTLRRLAPTQPRAMASAAGLLSGAIAAFAYSLYCREDSLSFTATWYTLGMLLPAAAGALFGRQLLHAD